MGSWVLPVAATAFAAGLIVWPELPVRVAPVSLLALGLAGLTSALFAGSRAARGPGALARARLVPPQAAAVRAVAAARPTGLGSPVATLLLTVVGVLALGMGWSGLHHRGLESSLLARLAPQRVTIEGVLQTDPSEATFGWSAVAQVRRIDWANGAATLRSLVWVSGDEDLPRARRGDRVRLEGVLRVPDDPGFAEVLRHKGIATQLGLDVFTRLGPSPSAFVRTTQSVARASWAVRSSASSRRRKPACSSDCSWATTRSWTPASSETSGPSGLSHLLVVSGGNVAMVLVPVLAATALLRLSRWPKFAVGFGAVAFFTVLTGAEPSVLRAGVMACLALVGVLIGRPRTTASILAAAVLGLLVLDPWLAWSVGFQLSVTATAGMVALASTLADRVGRFLPRPVAAAAGATLSAQLGVTPVLLFYFDEVPLVTLPANLAAFPLVAPSLLLGAVAAGAGLLPGCPLGKLLGAVAFVPMRCLELIADHLGKAPVGYLSAKGGPFVLLGGTAIVVAITVWIRTGLASASGGDRPRPRVPPDDRLGLGAGKRAAGGLTIRVLDIGQGDSILVTSPAGAIVLIDGGPEERTGRHPARGTRCETAGHGRGDASARRSHRRAADGPLAHPGGAAAPAGLRRRAHRRRASSTARSATRTSRSRNPRAGDVFRVGRPPIGRAVAGPMLDGHRVRCEQRFDRDPALAPRGHGAPDAGDAEIPVQEWLLEEGVLPDVDVLKVPHHGGGTSVPELFDAVHAEVAVVSVGVDNDYGHPNAEIMDAIVASGAQVWRTDLDGTVTVSFVGHMPTVESER